ncbi:MAG: metal-dependent hydrolase [Geminicoccaceae bacterium]
MKGKRSGTCALAKGRNGFSYPDCSRLGGIGRSDRIEGRCAPGGGGWSGTRHTTGSRCALALCRSGREDFTEHRSVTSLIVQALASPLFVFLLRPFFAKSAAGGSLSVVFAVFATHALLDAFTIYGTQLLWPLSRHPFGTGSVFIIDPVYTMPLLVATLVAFFRRHLTAKLYRATWAALLFGCAYLGWGLVAQAMMQARAERHLAGVGIEAERLLATPMPFSTLLWRVIAIDGRDYFNLYLPVFGGPDSGTLYRHERLALAASCLDGMSSFTTLARFTKGFYRTTFDGEVLRMADIRMGVTPDYVFDFVIGKTGTDGIEAVRPERVASQRRRDGDIAWLFAGIVGQMHERPAERRSLVVDFSSHGSTERARMAMQTGKTTSGQASCAG